MSEIRENKLTGEWVIIAPERAKRGQNLAPPPPTAPPGFCPFCPGNESASQEVSRVAYPDGEWRMRAVLNKFSALSPEDEANHGLHEVIIESRQHECPLLGPEEWPILFQLYLQRFLAFYDDPRIEHVILYKNHGADAGASQRHPHSQVVGLPILPGQVFDRLERSRRFYVEHGECLACHLLASERKAGTRIIEENAHFVAFIPYAALSPYHLWIFPKQHISCFADHLAIDSAASITRSVLARLQAVLGDPAFNLVLRSTSPREPSLPHFHWYLSIVARVNKHAGFELGTGMYINPSSPEDCASAMRGAAV